MAGAGEGGKDRACLSLGGAHLRVSRERALDCKLRPRCSESGCKHAALPWSPFTFPAPLCPRPSAMSLKIGGRKETEGEQGGRGQECQRKQLGLMNSTSAVFHSFESSQVSVPIRQLALTRAVLITTYQPLISG